MRVLHHLALRCLDCETTARFYETWFDLPRTRVFDDEGGRRSIWLASGDVRVMCERRVPGEAFVPAGTRELICFTVSEGEREALRGRFTAAGLVVEESTAHTLYLRDPDGRRVGVSSYTW